MKAWQVLLLAACLPYTAPATDAQPQRRVKAVEMMTPKTQQCGVVIRITYPDDYREFYDLPRQLCVLTEV